MDMPALHADMLAFYKKRHHQHLWAFVAHRAGLSAVDSLDSEWRKPSALEFLSMAPLGYARDLNRSLLAFEGSISNQLLAVREWLTLIPTDLLLQHASIAQPICKTHGVEILDYLNAKIHLRKNIPTSKNEPVSTWLDFVRLEECLALDNRAFHTGVTNMLASTRGAPIELGLPSIV